MISVNTLEYINLIVTDNKGYLIDRNGVDSIVNSFIFVAYNDFFNLVENF